MKRIETYYCFCSPKRLFYNYFFFKNQLLFFEIRELRFNTELDEKGNIHYNTDKTEETIEKFYLSKNKVFQKIIQEKKNNKLLKETEKKDFKQVNNEIKENLNGFIHLSKIFEENNIYNGRGKIRKHLVLSGKEKYIWLSYVVFVSKQNYS
ncbi:MAG: hypothetical protein GY830_06780 [Bacteroidetes bacterium]|nr:hypothetical protein [Bacteroidota bacterium]